MLWEYLRRLPPVVRLLAVLPILASCTTVSSMKWNLQPSPSLKWQFATGADVYSSPRRSGRRHRLLRLGPKEW